MICLILLKLLLIPMAIENSYIKKIEITENNVYSGALLDIEQLLIDEKKYNTETIQKCKIYKVTDKTKFSVIHKRLYVTPNIDREEICPRGPSESSNSLSKSKLLTEGSCSITDCCTIFNFHVDCGNSVSSFFILIIILDQNDNLPKFLPFNNPYITLPEDTPINTVIELPLATDDDSPIFGIKHYTISKPFLMGNSSHFLLSEKRKSDRANLIVAANLDRETVSKYRFLLRANDRNYDPAHETNEVEVEIKITDINDNVPSFDKPLYSTSVKEHSQFKDLIYFKISDSDEGANSDVSVSFDLENDIEKSQLTKLFRVDFSKSAMSGHVRLIDELDYEIHKHTYTFNLVATDNGRPRLSSTARITITVVNENDHAPSIKVTRQGLTVTRSIKIMENQPPETFVAFLQVGDMDSPVSKIDCQLLESQFIFNIKSTNEDNSLGLYKDYTIRTLKPLDREAELNDIHTIVIHCTDNDNTKPLTTNLTILVTIEDINDNPPVFTRSRYQSELLENSAQTVLKMTENIQTTDRDHGKYALATFKMDTSQNSTDWQSFSIDYNTGIISSKISIDYEEKKLFQFSIVAMDKDNNSLSSTAVIVVHIIDANDNPPVFGAGQYTFVLKENSKLNTVVGQIQSTDADTKPDNKNVKYVERNLQNSPQLIHVDDNTGQIRTIGAIDREKIKSISMIISAKNYVGYQNNNLIDPECIVSIIIEDENDNPPVFTPIDPTKTTITFFLNSAYKHDNCQQIPYMVSDPDQDESTADDCCTMKLDHDYNGRFFLTSTMPNFLCLKSSVISPPRYRISLTATDNKNNQNNSLETKISFNVFLKQEVVETNNLEVIEKIPSNKNSNSKNSAFSLIIVIVIVVVVCLLIIAFVLLILYRYVVNSSENFPKRHEDNTIQSSDNNIIKMECNQFKWSQEDSKLMYHVNTQRNNNSSHCKPMGSQEWYFERPIYMKDTLNSYQTMSSPNSTPKFHQSVPMNYEPLSFIPSSVHEYTSADNKTNTSSKFKTNTMRNVDSDPSNTNNEDNQGRYCQTSFV